MTRVGSIEPFERERERMSGGQKNTEDIVYNKRHHELRTATTTATATATN